MHDHKNHFKSKTIHIFERLIRRFGFDEVYANAGEKVEEKKVLVGIRKRKERAKKKRAGKDDEEEEGGKRQSMGNAFDDILYNSDSDLSSDEDEDAPGKGRNQAQGKGQIKGKKAQQQQQQQQREKREKGDVYIRNDEDEPMDLLSRSIAGGVSSKSFYHSKLLSYF